MIQLQSDDTPLQVSLINWLKMESMENMIKEIPLKVAELVAILSQTAGDRLLKEKTSLGETMIQLQSDDTLHQDSLINLLRRTMSGSVIVILNQTVSTERHQDNKSSEVITIQLQLEDILHQEQLTEQLK